MDDLLAWVTAVDDSDPQIPPTKPLDFLPAECVPLETESGKEWFFHGWSVTGNPESSDSQQKTVFAQTPTGFTQLSNNDEGATERCEFQNQAGDILILENCRIGLDSNTSIFSPISFDLEALQNSDLVKTVEVQGKDGRLYAASDYCELVWLENDYYVRLIYEGSVTVEQMLLWAESTVVQLE